MRFAQRDPNPCLPAICRWSYPLAPVPRDPKRTVVQRQRQSMNVARNRSVSLIELPEGQTSLRRFADAVDPNAVDNAVVRVARARTRTIEHAAADADNQRFMNGRVEATGNRPRRRIRG